MSFRGRANIDICNYLTVNDQNRFAVEKVAGIIKRTGRSEDVRFFDRIGDIYAVC